MSNDHLTPRTEPLAPGDNAPDFTLLDQNKEEWTLSAAATEGDVVLCFFPLAFTGVCESEMTCITSEFAAWSGRGAQVVGISCDSFATLKAWSDQLGLKQTMLADMHRHVCKAFGLYWDKLNVASRGTVVIRNSDGQLKVVWAQSREPASAMDFDEVLGSLG